MDSTRSQVLLVIIAFLVHAKAVEYFVHPSPCHSDTPCSTLQDYIQEAAYYFTSNSTFVFIEGLHNLNARLDVTNVTALSFKGSDKNTNQLVVSPNAGIFFYDSSDIEFQLLTIINTGQENDVSNIALEFNYSVSIRFTNVKFMHVNLGQSRSRAIHFSFSLAEITNCSFYNGYIKDGGVIKTYNSELIFSGRTIFDNNTADNSGGAIYAYDSFLTFSGNTTFTRNRAGTFYYPTKFDIGGGAICSMKTSITFEGYTEFSYNAPINSINNVLIGSSILAVENSTLNISGNSIFRNNIGYTGGGLFLANSECHISGWSDFLQNNATTKHGGAISAYRSQIHISASSKFTENYAMVSGGAIALDHSVLKNEGSARFTRNSVTLYGGGGVVVVNSIIEALGEIYFYENKGRYGGALLFIEDSYLQLKPPVNITFFANEALYGGAIQVFDSLPVYNALCENISIEPIDCFFRIQAQNNSIEDISLSFVENFVNFSGSSIYGGALELCRIQVNGIQTSMNGYNFLQNVSIFERRSDISSYFSSKALKVCMCRNGEASCSSDSLSINISTVPGRIFNISILSVGQLNMPEPSNIVNIFSSSNGSEIRPQTYNADKTTKCHDVGFQLFTNNLVENIQIYPEGCNSRNASIFIRITLEKCPPGFKLINKSCDCEERLKSVADEGICNIDSGLIRRPQNAWIQPVYKNQTYKGFFLSRSCYLPFCKEEDPQNPTLLNFSSPDVDSQCAPNRTGMVCGKCKENHSLVMNSLHCDVCEDTFLGLIIVFLLSGIILIAILLLLQMTVAKGTINGLILYCNFVNICYDSFFPPDKTVLNPLSVFIAWVNLDLGFPTCFYDGLDSYQYTWLQFVFPFYLWGLIGIIILACKVSFRIRSIFGSNPVAVFATVILLSFTKLLQTTVYALSIHALQNPYGSDIRYWWGDPNIPFFGKSHIPLAVASILIIVFLLFPYIILLLFGYRLLKFSGKKGFRWFNNFKPLLDAYYAPYTKRGRFWPGFMVLIRACLFLSFTIAPLYENNATLILSPSLFIAVATLAWVSGPIHEKIYLEILEASFILNICILPLVSYHFIAESPQRQLTVTFASVGIAFVEFVGIIVFHIILRVSELSCFKRIREKYFPSMKKFSLQVKSSETSKKNTVELEPEETAAFAIREPLLEDITIL